MTDFEKELALQILELSKDLVALRERVAVLESRQAVSPTWEPKPYVPSIWKSHLLKGTQ